MSKKMAQIVKIGRAIMQMRKLNTVETISIVFGAIVLSLLKKMKIAIKASKLIKSEGNTTWLSNIEI